MKWAAACAAILLLTAAPALASPPPNAPAVSGPEGQRAFEDLGSYYEGGAKPSYEAALDSFASPDSTARQRSGAYLLALFAQSREDENNGRSEWRPTPFWGGGSESDARNLRQELAKEFGRRAHGTEALPALRWLVEDEPVLQIQSDGVEALPRIRSPETTALIGQVLREPHTNVVALETALHECGARRLTELKPAVLALCQHFQPRVRRAAAAAAESLGVSTVPQFVPEQAIKGLLQRDLDNILDRVETPPPPHARWVHVDPRPFPRGEGWLLFETDSTIRILNEYGQEVTCSKLHLRISNASLSREAERLVQIRATSSDRALMDSLSEEGGLTGQFEAGVITIPEALVAAWCYERGDRAKAAAVLLPCLNAMVDSRELDWITRDLLGGIYHRQMLQCFSYDRDYARTIAVAQHLSKPVFDGYVYQLRAKELGEQLARRGDDFRSFALPDSSQWQELQAGFSRSQQVVFLSERLRLLNCFQWMQPGGVGFSDPQYEEASHLERPFDSRPNLSRRLINPWDELVALHLRVADIPALLPFLQDRNFMPTFEFWRDFAPDRKLYRVCDAVEYLINDTANRTLVDASRLATMDAQAQKEELARIEEWAKTHAEASGGDLTLELLSTTKEQNEFWHGADEAAKAKDPRAAAIVLRRMDEFPMIREYLVEDLYRLDSPEAVPRARAWVKGPIDRYEGPYLQSGIDALKTNSVLFWASMILLRHGDRAHEEGLPKIAELLGRGAGLDWVSPALDELLALGTPQAREVGCGSVRVRDLHLDEADTGVLLRKLVRLRCNDAYEFLVESLRDSTPADSFPDGGRPLRWHHLTRADRAAIVIAEWRGNSSSLRQFYDFRAPVEARVGQREQLRAWLVEQHRLLESGARSEL